MRRKDKEMESIGEIEAVVREASVCRLGMTDGEWPYVVPLCFGYKENVLYFHSAPRGRKLDILRKNNRVCFEFDISGDAKSAAQACNWGMPYRSVIGFGTASIVEDADEKKAALDIIMAHYSGGDGPFEYPKTELRRTAIIKVHIEEMTGKRSG